MSDFSYLSASSPEPNNSQLETSRGRRVVLGRVDLLVGMRHEHFVLLQLHYFSLLMHNEKNCGFKPGKLAVTLFRCASQPVRMGNCCLRPNDTVGEASHAKNTESRSILEVVVVSGVIDL